jgi:hypothetical protein
MRQLPVMKTAQVTLNAAGAGKVTLSPGMYGVTWHLTQASVRTIQSVITKEAKAQLESFPYSLPGTFSGSSGDTTGLDLTLSASQQISCTWSGGDPGAVATLSISGTQTIEGG